MFTIALELKFVAGSPFLVTWGTLALGEFASLFIGAFIMDKLGKRVDLSR